MIRFENVNLDYTGFQMIVPGLKNATFTFGSRGLVNIYEEGYLKRNAITDLIAAIRRPDSGEIYVQGLKISEFDETKAADYRSRYVTALFRNFQFLEDKTAAENIAFYYEIRGFPRQKAMEETTKLVQELDFLEHATKLPKEFNEYDKPLLFIAIAFAINRPITVMDGIDFKFNQKTLQALSRFAKEHLLIIKSLKDSGVREVCDRHIVMIDGVIKSDTGGTTYDEDNQIAIIGKKLRVSSKTYNKGTNPIVKQLPMFFVPMFLFAFFSAFLTRWISALFYVRGVIEPSAEFSEFLSQERISNIVFAVIIGLFFIYNIFSLTIKQLRLDASMIAKMRLAGVTPNNIIRIYLTRFIIPTLIFVVFGYGWTVLLPIFNVTWIVNDLGLTTDGSFLSIYISALIATFFSFILVVVYQTYLLKSYLSERLSKFMVNLNKKS